MVSDAEIVRKAEGILAKFPAVRASWTKGERISGRFTDQVALGALSIEVTNLANLIYGEGSPNAIRIIEQIRGHTKSQLDAAEGMLRGTISSIQSGLIADLRTQVLLDVQDDFVEAARVALGNGNKDVAAVLLAVVLEDSTKRLAMKAGEPDLVNKEFSVVVTTLLSKGVINKSTKSSLLSFKDLRNAALHAQWDHVSTESVQGLLYFLSTFLENHGV